MVQGTTHFQRVLLAVLIRRPIVLDPVAILAGRVIAEREQPARWTAKGIGLRFLGKACGSWLIGPKNRNPGRNILLFEEGIIEAVGVACIGHEVAHH